MRSNGRLPLTHENVLARAERALGMPTKYRLGSGGRNPGAPVPTDENGEVDCSGFVAWCLGYDRLQENGEWENTSQILEEALYEPRHGHNGVRLDNWAVVHPDDDVIATDCLVYPWTDGHPGHVAVITAVKAGFKRGRRIPFLEWWRYLDIVHSAPSNQRKFGHSVAKTNARVFRNSGYIVRYLGFGD